jgi:hypothetical protein
MVSDRTLETVRAPTKIVLAGILALGIGLPVVALGPSDPIDRGATAVRPAVPVSPIATDVVTVYNSGELRSDVAARSIAAARSVGASLAFGRSASVGMQGLYRGTAVIQVPPAGFSYPMGTTVLPSDVVARTMGRNVSQHLTADTLVMGALSAGLRGAQAGDTALLIGGSGAGVWFRIAAVLPDAEIGGAEFLMSTQAGDRLGISRLSRAVMWGFPSREAIDASLAENGLVATSVRIRRSWDAPDPDDTIGMSRTKALLGEFAYRVNANGSVSQDAAWLAASLPAGRVLLSSALPVRARCHNVVEPALRAALDEIAARGLGATIDVVNANTYGGCHLARFNRLTPDSSLGFLSRHSWAMAFDTNTVGSCQGCAPPDFATRPGGCTAVRIFRKHGFAWGGNFLTPDGMHFEYVGERRDLMSYPSRWCANTGAAALVDDDAGFDTFFADDGLSVGEH